MNELENYRKKQKTEIRRASIHQFHTNKRYIFEYMKKPEKVSIV